MTPGNEINDIPYYGYIYMWTDIKRQMFYIGSHKGSFYDSYKASNTRLKHAIRKRPDTFTVRVIEYVCCNDRHELHKVEEKWLKFYNVDANYAFYNHKKTASGGSGPSSRKGLTHKQFYGDDYIDPRKGKTLEQIYGDEATVVRNRLSKTLQDYYIKHGHGIKKGITHDGVDPRKGKTLEEIYGYKKYANPPKPFKIMISIPGQNSVYETFESERDFFKRTLFEATTLDKIKKDKRHTVKRRLPSTKHKYPVGTTFLLYP
jgi:hypothetical protein